MQKQLVHHLNGNLLMNRLVSGLACDAMQTKTEPEAGYKDD